MLWPSVVVTGNGFLGELLRDRERDEDLRENPKIYVHVQGTGRSGTAYKSQIKAAL